MTTTAERESASTAMHDGDVDARDADGDSRPVLSVKNLEVTYGIGDSAVSAVKNVSFDIASGERVALVGESGSGKSTLAMTIAGLVNASTGATVSSNGLEFEGITQTQPTGRGLPERTAGIAMVFQDAMTALDPVWTIGGQFKHVLAGAGVRRGRDRTDLATHWLNKVGLHDTERVLRSRPYELSGGMRQRVMTALALCGSPRLLIADEPTSALDASLARGTMELLQELTREQGTALLIVSHDIKLCLEFSDTMLVMYRGELIEQQPSATIASTAVHPYTKGLLGCVPTLSNRSAFRLPVLRDFVSI
ncbi:ABC transporter ATP-binding protein [Rhodococcoides kyotonense]|uniref:Peptide/nickel transport system ATP-binding protein n=1 Tax=Rhodococcoides kyotonense TaxID=398843 RepID=A0A239H553_9NOCA|nr:ABC transporter ATP-binding protein [Rhodococcus kyotonensis]SNS76500.1 peptide/nickel transport system ATP-binding protein [Rhodococcus kyotonensis]